MEGQHILKGAAMSWYIRAIKNYTNFSGRAQRSEFWFFVLFYNLIGFSLLLVDATIQAPLFSILFLLWNIIPGLSVTFRRLHDTGRSGWWLLLALIPIPGGPILVWFYARDSQPGSNIYGENPKGILLENPLPTKQRVPSEQMSPVPLAASEDEVRKLEKQLQTKDEAINDLNSSDDQVRSDNPPPTPNEDHSSTESEIVDAIEPQAVKAKSVREGPRQYSAGCLFAILFLLFIVLPVLLYIYLN